MNEKLRELDCKAVEYALSVVDANGLYQGKAHLEVVKEKFAELIIQETFLYISGEFGLMWDDGLKTTKQYFGLKS